MPRIAPRNLADRALHLYENARYRKDGSVILAPEDLMEGAGNLSDLDADGNPQGADGTPTLALAATPNPDGWFPYIAPAGSPAPTRQASAALPITRQSFAANQPLIEGDLAPALLASAPLPRPEAPLVLVEGVGSSVGYPASTAERPYWYAVTFYKRAHTDLSAPVALPPVANGQGITVALPQDPPEGTTAIGVWLTEPGRSTSTTPGPFRLQRLVSVASFVPATYDLTGPYRYDSGRAPSGNNTRLPTPARPTLSFSKVQRACRPGQYVARVTWVDANGESLPSPATPTRGVGIDHAYDRRNPKTGALIEASTCGMGELTVTRPSSMPSGARGWRAYLYVSGEWYCVVDARHQTGNERPLNASMRSISTCGWTGPDDHPMAKNQNFFLQSRDLPTENGTGIESPEDAPEEPVVGGAARPPAGTYRVGVTETLNGRESVVSPLTTATISGSQTMRVVRRGPGNRVPNPANRELGANGLPLDQATTTTGGSARVEGETLVLATNGPQPGATPANRTKAVAVDASRDWTATFELEAAQPETGLFSGVVRAYLDEYDAAMNLLGSTVLVDLPRPGAERAARVIRAAGSTPAAGEHAWRPETAHAALSAAHALGTDAAKNATVRIGTRTLSPGAAADFGTAEAFGGTDADVPGAGYALAAYPVEDPEPYAPRQGGAPDLVAWPEPDRPRETGAALVGQPVHTFETGFPAGWAQRTSGNGALTRPTDSQLSGTGSMRSGKAVS